LADPVAVPEDVVLPATEESPGRVAEGSEPTVDTGDDPAVVEPEEVLEDSESVPVVDADPVISDEVVEVSVDELVDSDDELDDSEELDDESESFGAANAAPIPPVPTNPTTPSEKARAPTLRACFCEFTWFP
jgi:hypothetical protein